MSTATPRVELKTYQDPPPLSGCQIGGSCGGCTICKIKPGAPEVSVDKKTAFAVDSAKTTSAGIAAFASAFSNPTPLPQAGANPSTPLAAPNIQVVIKDTSGQVLIATAQAPAANTVAHVQIVAAITLEQLAKSSNFSDGFKSAAQAAHQAVTTNNDPIPSGGKNEFYQIKTSSTSSGADSSPSAQPSGSTKSSELGYKQTSSNETQSAENKSGTDKKEAARTEPSEKAISKELAKEQTKETKEAAKAEATAALEKAVAKEKETSKVAETSKAEFKTTAEFKTSPAPASSDRQYIAAEIVKAAVVSHAVRESVQQSNSTRPSEYSGGGASSGATNATANKLNPNSPRAEEEKEKKVEKRDVSAEKKEDKATAPEKASGLSATPELKKDAATGWGAKSADAAPSSSNGGSNGGWGSSNSTETKAQPAASASSFFNSPASSQSLSYSASPSNNTSSWGSSSSSQSFNTPPPSNNTSSANNTSWGSSASSSNSTSSWGSASTSWGSGTSQAAAQSQNNASPATSTTVYQASSRSVENTSSITGYKTTSENIVTTRSPEPRQETRQPAERTLAARREEPIMRRANLDPNSRVVTSRGTSRDATIARSELRAGQKSATPQVAVGARVKQFADLVLSKLKELNDVIKSLSKGETPAQLKKNELAKGPEKVQAKGTEKTLEKGQANKLDQKNAKVDAATVKELNKLAALLSKKLGTEANPQLAQQQMEAIRLIFGELTKQEMNALVKILTESLELGNEEMSSEMIFQAVSSLRKKKKKKENGLGDEETDLYEVGSEESVEEDVQVEAPAEQATEGGGTQVKAKTEVKADQNGGPKAQLDVVLSKEENVPEDRKRDREEAFEPVRIYRAAQ